jgi:methyl-accepting chemotaxis protein
LEKTQAVVTLSTSGIVEEANDLFLKLMGYARNEVIGKHHRMFVEAKEAGRPEYEQFWRALREGVAQQGEFKRIAKSGAAVWLSSTYTPICSPSGKVVKIVKFAQDVSKEKLRNADFEGQIAAIGRTQAVVTFSPDSVIQDANDLFLEAMGYTREEVVRSVMRGCVGCPFGANRRALLRLGKSTECLWTICNRQCT